MRRLLSTRDVPAVCKGRCVDSPAGSSVVPPTRYQRPGGIVGQICVVNAKKASGLLPVRLAISGGVEVRHDLAEVCCAECVHRGGHRTCKMEDKPSEVQDDIRTR
eukprot:2085005-Prymnesium_polylepis.1